MELRLAPRQPVARSGPHLGRRRRCGWCKPLRRGPAPELPVSFCHEIAGPDSLLPTKPRLRGNRAPMIRAGLKAIGLTPLAGLVAGRKVGRVAKTNIAVAIADVVICRAGRRGRSEPALRQGTLVGEQGNYHADQQCFHVHTSTARSHRSPSCARRNNLFSQGHAGQPPPSHGKGLFGLLTAS